MRPYGPGDAELWDAAVRRSRSAHFLFRRGYMDYHRDRFEDASVIVERGGRVLALLPASRDGDTIVSHGGLTFGGLLSDASLTARRALLALDAVCGHLAGAGARTLVYKAVPHIYHREPAEEDLYALWRSGARLVRRDLSSTIRLGAPRAISKGRRSGLRDAQRSGLQVRASGDFGAFIALATQVLGERHGAIPVHTAAELELLAGRFGDEIALHVALCDGELVAGMVVYATELVAHAQYIAVSQEGRRRHALDALVEHLISERYADRRWFDFGISTVDGGRRLNEALARNKESYGARAIAYDWYELPLRP